VDTNRCGNVLIDGMAATGRLMSIWDRLGHKFPMVAAHAETIWIARKDGRIRNLVERDGRFGVLLTSQDTGPQSDAEWELLAIAALTAIGREPCEGELGKRDGLWVGQDFDDYAVVDRHKDCEWCKKGFVPCPMQGYPLAHTRDHK